MPFGTENSSLRNWLLVMVMVLGIALLAGFTIVAPETGPASEGARLVEQAALVPVYQDQSELLVDKLWVLVGYGDAANPTVVEEGTVVTAEFGSDGSLSGSAGCNNYSFRYKLGENSSLTVTGPALITHMACPVGMEQEQAYLAALHQAESYLITEEGRLEITYDSGTVVGGKLIYALGQVPLTDTQWVLVSYGNPQDPQLVQDGTTITAIFSGDEDRPAGLVSGSAGCNTYSGVYVTADADQMTGQLTIEGLVSTQKICSTGMAQEEAYLAALETAETYQIIGRRLEINYAGGQGKLTYTSAQLPLENTLWTLVSYGDPDAARPVAEGTHITALFEQDLEDEERDLLLDRGFLQQMVEPTGTVGGSAGCNAYSAAYQTDGEELTIDTPLTTRQVCPGLMEDEGAYLAALEAADSFQIVGDQLEITYGKGVGVLNFVADRTPLEGTLWSLVSYGPVEGPQGLIADTAITALFGRPIDAPSGVVAGTTGCNLYEATYTASLTEMKVNRPTATERACGDAVAEQERAYLLGLNAASTYRILGDMLQITYGEANGVLNYIATQPQVAPPTAVIKAPPESEVGQLVPFDGSESQAATPIQVYLWDFGDGTFANGSQVSHAYQEPGAYNVTLTVIDSAGLSDSAVHQIEIKPAPEVPPTAVIEGPDVAKVDEEVTFNGGNSEPGSSPIVAYAWNFGNGETVEPSPDPSVTTQYDRPGVYQVLLVVTDANGLSDATSMEILVFDTATPTGPTAVIQGPEVAQVGRPVPFSGVESLPGDAPIVLYSWAFGDGRVTDSPIPVTATVYQQAGSYQVTLTVVDGLGLSDTSQMEITTLAADQPTPAPPIAPTPPAVPQPSPEPPEPTEPPTEPEATPEPPEEPEPTEPEATPEQGTDG